MTTKVSKPKAKLVQNVKEVFYEYLLMTTGKYIAETQYHEVNLNYLIAVDDLFLMTVVDLLYNFKIRVLRLENIFSSDSHQGSVCLTWNKDTHKIFAFHEIYMTTPPYINIISELTELLATYFPDYDVNSSTKIGY